MHCQSTARLALSVAVAACCATPVYAVAFTCPDGTWKFSADGNVNADHICDRWRILLTDQESNAARGSELCADDGSWWPSEHLHRLQHRRVPGIL